MEPTIPADPTAPAASSALLAFLAPAVDRAAFIGSWLAERNIPHRVVTLSGKRHVIVRFESGAYDPNFRTKLLVAHHDRAPGSPGANDNGAACFQLLLLAERLAGSGSAPQSGNSGGGGARWKGVLRKTHNTVILFTDGEEAAGSGGIRDQGSFAIGSGLKALGLDDADVFVFDACGRGDTLVVSGSGHGKAGTAYPGKAGGSLTFASRSGRLREQARDIAREAAGGRWVSLLTPYSDNAGFLAAGLPSQVITVLPQAEADTLLLALAGKGAGVSGKKDIAELERLVTANPHGKRAELASAALLSLIPETWRLMHGSGDKASTLTAEAFTLMRDFLDCLAASLEPL